MPRLQGLWEVRQRFKKTVYQSETRSKYWNVATSIGPGDFEVLLVQNVLKNTGQYRREVCRRQTSADCVKLITSDVWQFIHFTLGHLHLIVSLLMNYAIILSLVAMLGE